MIRNTFNAPVAPKSSVTSVTMRALGRDGCFSFYVIFVVLRFRPATLKDYLPVRIFA